MYQQDTGLIFWKPVRLNKQESRTHGWHAVVEQTTAESPQWRAFIEPTTGGDRLVASVLFSDEDDAIAWCEGELARRLLIVRLAFRQEYPEPVAELRQTILDRLRQYDTQTARRMVTEVLARWDAARTQILYEQEGYRDAFGLGLEGGYYFWHVIREMDFSLLDPSFPPGTIGFGDDWRQIEHAGREWGQELARLPLSFYAAVYTYTLAVYDWLRTCDLRPYMQPGKPAQDVIQEFIDGWKIQVGLD